MPSVNKVTLVGYVGTEPAIKDITSGKLVNFTLATTDRWKSGDGHKEKTEWHRCVAFDKAAELCAKILKQGQLLYVEGSLSYSKYNDKVYAQVTVRTIQVLSQGKGGEDLTE